MSGLEPKAWQKLGEKKLASCQVFDLFEAQFKHPDGRTGNFYTIHSGDWVQIFALTKKNTVLLVNQFRMGVQKNSWELPGGIVEDGESPLLAGLRELEEETGYAGENAKILAIISPNPAIQSNRAHLVFVENCKQSAPLNWDANEELEIKEFSLNELDDMVASGKIHHSIAINGIYFAQKYLEKTQKIK